MWIGKKKKIDVINFYMPQDLLGSENIVSYAL